MRTVSCCALYRREACTCAKNARTSSVLRSTTSHARSVPRTSVAPFSATFSTLPVPTSSCCSDSSASIVWSPTVTTTCSARTPRPRRCSASATHSCTCGSL